MPDVNVVQFALAEAARRGFCGGSASHGLHLADSFELAIAPGEQALVLVVALEPAMSLSVEAALRAFRLTPREIQIARALEERLSTAEIARHFGISPHTVRRHVERILRKLGIQSRKEIRRVFRERSA